jgi:hypothetical protein
MKEIRKCEDIIQNAFINMKEWINIECSIIIYNILYI